MKLLLKTIVLLCIFTNTTFAQTSPCVEIKNQLDSIYSSYKYYPIYLEGKLESNIILMVNIKNEFLSIDWLKKTGLPVFGEEIKNTLNSKITYNEDCNCIFRFDFDITYLKEKFTTKFDSLLISEDSLSILEKKFDVFDIKVKGGEEWTKWLNQSHKKYLEDKAKSQFNTTNLKEEVSRKVRRSKDSIFIVIHKYVLLFEPMNENWTISYNSKKDKWKSNTSLNSTELLELTNAFIAIPKHPKNSFYGHYNDGVVYVIEVKIGEIYRTFAIANPLAYYNDYEIWLDAEYIRLIELLKK